MNKVGLTVAMIVSMASVAFGFQDDYALGDDCACPATVSSAATSQYYMTNAWVVSDRKVGEAPIVNSTCNQPTGAQPVLQQMVQSQIVESPVQNQYQVQQTVQPQAALTAQPQCGGSQQYYSSQQVMAQPTYAVQQQPMQQTYQPVQQYQQYQAAPQTMSFGAGFGVGAAPAACGGGGG